MKSSSRILMYLLPLCFVIGGTIMSFSIIEKTDVYKTEKATALTEMSFQTRLANTIDEYGLDRVEVMEKYDSYYARLNGSRINYDEGVTVSLYIVGAIAVFLVFMIFLFYRGPLFWRATTMATVAAALVLLVIGIFAPMLEVVAFLEDVHVGFEVMFVELNHTWYGNMYAFYQNKSIIDVVGVLFEKQNYVVAIALVTFSVIVPSIKLSLTVITILSKSIRKNKKLIWIVQNIGKWSMADVMVVSIILSMMAFNNMNAGDGIETETTALLGIYFFFSYVVVAIISSMLLKNAMKEIDGETTTPTLQEEA